MASAIQRDGGFEEHIDKLTIWLIDKFYEMTTDEFYVTSFCGLPKDEYTASNGLLSQWRAYGTTQGFALELDTEKLENLFRSECDSFSYSTCSFGDVVYGDKHHLFNEDFVPRFDILKGYVAANLRAEFEQRNAPDETLAFQSFCYCATMLKHEGFKEEQEVRVAFQPVKQDAAFLDGCKRAGIIPNPEKPIQLRTKNGVPVPYIAVLGRKNDRLPITRIIVGPGHQKVASARALMKLVDPLGIPVTVCDTPFA